MRHFPIFLDLTDRLIIVSGGGETALAKLRLLLKTSTRIRVFSPHPHNDIARLADAQRLQLVPRALNASDLAGATLVYAANADPTEDRRIARMARELKILVNVVDDLEGSDFITPAIVDRNPVTIAIGTQGAAPVLARAIKADFEERLSPLLGPLAEMGKRLRPLAKRLPSGARRRNFWTDFYLRVGPQAFEQQVHEHQAGEKQALHKNNPDAVFAAGRHLIEQHLQQKPRAGHVDFVGAGPGDPELLTLKARKALENADVVIHDRLISDAVLDLARREAVHIQAGKQGFAPSTPQASINAALIEHAGKGLHVVRLKSGDPAVFGRLEEEIEPLVQAGITYSVIPGITAASAAAAQIGRSLTRRGRNSDVRLVTGHDAKGMAEHDWRALARPGAVAALYMSKKAARFIQGRLLMHGANPATPVTVVENATHADQRTISTQLGALGTALSIAPLHGPAMILFGLAPQLDAPARAIELEMVR